MGARESKSWEVMVLLYSALVEGSIPCGIEPPAPGIDRSGSVQRRATRMVRLGL